MPQCEAGDTLWLDDKTLLIGRGYRTNEAGITQMRNMLCDQGSKRFGLRLAVLPGRGGVPAPDVIDQPAGGGLSVGAQGAFACGFSAAS